MNRQEILLEGHHIFLKSRWNVVENMGIHISPFILDPEVYEILYPKMMDRETAYKQIFSEHQQDWRRLEGRTLSHFNEKDWERER